MGFELANGFGGGAGAGCRGGGRPTPEGFLGGSGGDVGLIFRGKF